MSIYVVTLIPTCCSLLGLERSFKKFLWIIVLVYQMSCCYLKSEVEEVKCGVLPQGSVLGPLLFIITINDICNASDLLFDIMYADDAFALKEDVIRKSTKTTLLTNYIHVCTSHHQQHMQTLYIVQNELI